MGMSLSWLSSSSSPEGDVGSLSKGEGGALSSPVGSSFPICLGGSSSSSGCWLWFVCLSLVLFCAFACGCGCYLAGWIDVY